MNARRKILAFGVVAVVALITIAGKRSPHLSLSFNVAGTDFSRPYGPESFLTISNTGSTAAKWGYRGGWIEAETPTGSLTNNLPGGGILEPGKQAVLRIVLPRDALRWRVRCVASEASIRQRVSFKLRHRWDGNIRHIGRKILANTEGPEQIFLSESFNAQNFVQAPEDTANPEFDLKNIMDFPL